MALKFWFHLAAIILLLSGCLANKVFAPYLNSSNGESNALVENELRFSSSAGNRIKITQLDDIHIPSGYGYVSVPEGKHSLQICYSEEYSCGQIHDAWGGNCCSIYSNFNSEASFQPNHSYKFIIEIVKKSFAYQEFKAFLKDQTTGEYQLLPLLAASTGLDCYKDEPDALDFIGGPCS